MLSRSLFGALFALSLAASGCATGWGSSNEVDERIARLEREIDALKQGAPGKPVDAPAGAAAPAGPAAAGAPVSVASATPEAAVSAPPPAAAAKPAEKPPLLWQVTPDISFKPGLRLQTRYEYDTRSNNNDLFIARFRLKASGDAYEFLKYGLELKIDNTGRTNASPSAAVENGWLDFIYANELIGRAGLYDVPFSRDALTSDSKLLFVDRSLIKDALTGFGLADNGIGVMARGRPFAGRFEYAVGVFNNDKFDGLRTSRSPRTAWLMPMGRVAVDLLDPAPPGGYADYKASYIGKGQRLTLGANGAWLGNAQAGATQEFDLFAWGADLFFNKGPWTLQAEYDWFRLTGNVDRSNYGWFVQGGYLLEPLNKRLDEVAPWFPDVELAARYQDLDAKSFRTARERQTGVGMNFYIRDHNLKIQTDYLFRQLEDTEDRGLYQLQLQLDF